MRIIKTVNGYELVSIHPDDAKKFRDKLTVENANLLERCFELVASANETKDWQLEQDGVATLAAALFSTLALKMYSVLKDAEDIKVFNEKEQARMVCAANSQGGSVV